MPITVNGVPLLEHVNREMGAHNLPQFRQRVYVPPEDPLPRSRYRKHKIPLELWVGSEDSECGRYVYRVYQDGRKVKVAK